MNINMKYLGIIMLGITCAVCLAAFAACYSKGYDVIMDNYRQHSNVICSPMYRLLPKDRLMVVAEEAAKSDKEVFDKLMWKEFESHNFVKNVEVYLASFGGDAAREDFYKMCFGLEW